MNRTRHLRYAAIEYDGTRPNSFPLAGRAACQWPARRRIPWLRAMLTRLFKS